MSEASKLALSEVQPRVDEARSDWLHEDNLMNHRITWLLAMNGLLLTTLGLLYGKPGAFTILLLVSSVGLVTSVSIGLAVWVSIRKIHSLAEYRDDLMKLRAEHSVLPERKVKPIPRVVRRALKILYPWRAIPALSVVIWASAVVWLLMGGAASG